MKKWNLAHVSEAHKEWIRQNKTVNVAYSCGAAYKTLAVKNQYSRSNKADGKALIKGGLFVFTEIHSLALF